MPLPLSATSIFVILAQILLISDEMAGYMVDLNSPSNLTKNRDGQETGQHGLWLRLTERLPQAMGKKLKLSSDAANFLDKPDEYVFYVDFEGDVEDARDRRGALLDQLVEVLPLDVLHGDVGEIASVVAVESDLADLVDRADVGVAESRGRAGFTQEALAMVEKQKAGRALGAARGAAFRRRAHAAASAVIALVVTTGRFPDGWVAALGKADETELARLLERAVRSGLPLFEFHLLDADLEEIFLKVTGGHEVLEVVESLREVESG